jgi:Kae1-associated kinase Bud32
MRGAEAVLAEKRLIGRKCVVKDRIPKAYRVRELDARLRAERTRSEARLLHKAKLAGVECPAVLELDEFSITMDHVEGERPEMDSKEACEAGRILAKLHAAGIIHGDYTPANLITGKAGAGGKEGRGKTRSARLTVIDFGLGFISNDIEDKAVDVFTMLRALNDAAKGAAAAKKAKDAFISGYMEYAKAEQVLARVKVVEMRVRYAA